MNRSNWHEFIKGLYRENPVLVSLLGLCPSLAVTTQTINGITMGLSTTMVLLGSNVIISLLKNQIPANLRIPSYIVVIATFVTLIKITLEAFSPDVNAALGIFIPLIVVNCIILGRAEAFASKNSVSRSALDALGMGVGFTLVLTLVALIREILGAGQITLKVADWGSVYDLKGLFEFLGLVNAHGEKAPFLIFLLPPGAFIILGLLMGFMNFLQNHIKKRILVIKQKKLLSDQNKPLKD
ncbi:MAG: electron transport complex subunit RsxE [Spirochaetae bacterium HGW-Spirochaetae-6]|jgi:electron transport complex protein RnfE|nr:MAG: electron transport complex subunit RsxE [Spirochaetae bacterium HGW-Spirochaetae-6]